MVFRWFYVVFRWFYVVLGGFPMVSGDVFSNRTGFILGVRGLRLIRVLPCFFGVP